MKNKCSVVDGLEIVGGVGADYMRLCGWHYRESGLGPYCSIYVIRDNGSKLRIGGGVVGVIVYKMPTPNVELRNVAVGGLFSGYGDRRLKLQMVNRNVRCISRVIIEPRYRGLGLGSWLVRETLALAGVAVVESLAVMGAVNPFFERAGMVKHVGKVGRGVCQMRETLEMVGVDERMMVDPAAVYEKVRGLPVAEKNFFDGQVKRFLQGYGKRRNMAEGVERMRFVLSRIGERPVYFCWINDKVEIR